MDFGLTEEQRLFASSIRAFAEHELAQGALERAHQPHYPFDIANKLAKQGLLGLTIPEADGGGGGKLIDAVIAIQEVALICPTSADVVQTGNFGAIRTLAGFGTPDQKKRFLPHLLAGDQVIALGMSEPEAGSAVTDLTTRATPDGPDHYVIDGTKIWSSFSQEASVFLVYVRFGPGIDGIGSVLVERDTPGFTLSAPHIFMSGDTWSELQFVNCRIPATNVLLGAGGFRKQISGFNVERIGNASRALALGRYAFNIALDYAMTRQQFGRPISEFQGIQWKFAEMSVKLEAAQLLLYKATANADDGFPSAHETAMAKYAANIAGFEVANESLQVMGATGYSSETLVEFCVRKTRGWMIAGGSLEMMKNRIAEGVFGQHFTQRRAD